MAIGQHAARLAVIDGKYTTTFESISTFEPHPDDDHPNGPLATVTTRDEIYGLEPSQTRGELNSSGYADMRYEYVGHVKIITL